VGRQHRGCLQDLNEEPHPGEKVYSNNIHIESGERHIGAVNSAFLYSYSSGYIAWS
jgi:hypothetical protein